MTISAGIYGMTNQNNLVGIITKLYQALDAAHDHLEYCGYGDSEEHRQATSKKLPEKIEAALSDAHDAIPSLKNTI